MKYVIPQGGGGDYRPYARYLESVKHLMPAHLFAFAANSENFDLRSPNSLDDAWLEEWSIVEVVLPNERRKRLIEIRACFLGPQHDRHILLTYKNVGSYTMQNPEQFEMPPIGRVAHGDLLIHELTVVREGYSSMNFGFRAERYLLFSSPALNIGSRPFLRHNMIDRSSRRAPPLSRSIAHGASVCGGDLPSSHQVDRANQERAFNGNQKRTVGRCECPR